MTTATRAPRWLWVVAAWIVVAVALGAFYFKQADQVPLLGDSDDAMRLVLVMDLLDGQAWQDLGVSRDNTPFGGQMHWSRLVDAPLALLTMIGGLNFAAMTWPLLLVLPALALTVAATQRLAPKAGVVVIAALFLLNLVTFSEFVPGRVDHHNVQIILVEAMLVALLLGRRTSVGGALAGLAGATALAIGMETIVIVVAAGAALAICWLAAPLLHRRGMVGFGAGFASGAIAHFLIATPPSLYFAVACDVLSIVYVTAATLGGGAMAMSALLASERPLSIRLVALLGLGAIAIAVIAVLFPVCLGGPYAQIDPRMMAELFPIIGEAQPLLRAFATQPVTTWLYSGTVLLSLVVAAWRVFTSRGEAREDWLVLFLMLAAACMVLVLQLRGTRLATILAIPSGAWVVALLVHSLRPGVGRVLGVLAGLLAFAPVLQMVPLGLATARSEPPARFAEVARFETCRMEQAFTQLASLPPSRLAADVVIASHVLRYTPHSVLSAGFHRNGRAATDNVDFFANDVLARAIASERGLEYVVTCGHDQQLAQRSWLQRVPGDGPIEIYRIDTVGIQ